MDARPILDATVCPIVKRIWTPSWVVASTAWTCWMLAAFYWVIDVRGYKRWSLPLAAVGANSIAIYLMYQLMKPFIVASIQTPHGAFSSAGRLDHLSEGSPSLGVLWLICLVAVQAEDLLQESEPLAQALPSVYKGDRSRLTCSPPSHPRTPQFRCS